MRTWAEACYINWRNTHPAHRYPNVERRRLELRAVLDDVDEDLKSRRPDDWYEHQITWTDADAEERQVEILRIIAEHEAEAAGRGVDDGGDSSGGISEDDAEDAGGQVEGSAEAVGEEAEDKIIDEAETDPPTRSVEAEEEQDVDLFANQILCHR
jgi:hypothetical protein